MAARDHVSAEYLASIMELRDGVLFWKARGETWFDARHAGRPVCIRKSSRGYRLVRINKRSIAAHRVIWALHHGSWPKQYIDHINGDRADNRIDNLRDVSMTINNLNTARSRTGGEGVHYSPKYGSWIAQIRHDGRCTHLGSFATRDEALRARRVAERLVHGMELELRPAREMGMGGIRRACGRAGTDGSHSHVGTGL